MILKNRKKNKNKEKNGFTLIELLVSVTLFTIILTIAMTSLYSILNANKKTKTLKMVINNLNMAIESMSREIRVGYDYTCGVNTAIPGGQDCNSDSSSTFSFITKDGKNAYYEYDPSGKTIKRKITGKENNSVTIVGDDMDIDRLDFYVVGTDSGDNIQPRVLIVIKGSVKKDGVESVFNLQTTISQRRLSP